MEVILRTVISIYLILILKTVFANDCGQLILDELLNINNVNVEKIKNTFEQNIEENHILEPPYQGEGIWFNFNNVFGQEGTLSLYHQTSKPVFDYFYLQVGYTQDDLEEAVSIFDYLRRFWNTAYGEPIKTTSKHTVEINQKKSLISVFSSNKNYVGLVWKNPNVNVNTYVGLTSLNNSSDLLLIIITASNTTTELWNELTNVLLGG